MALDGIVRMVDAYFRHWDDAEKMWSEYERGGFRLIVIGGELRLSELRPVERMKYRCKHRRLVERWRDMRLEGSKLDGVADAGALDEGRELGLFEDRLRVLILSVREICPCLPNAQQTCCERTGHRAVQQRDELVALHSTADASQRPLLTTPQHACVAIGESRLTMSVMGHVATDYTSRFRAATSR
jgi:hypothetical protein